MTREKPWVRHYSDGVPAEITEPTTSLVEMFARSVREAGKATALEFFGARTSYRELGREVEVLARYLADELGVRAGDRVALVLPNCPQHVVAFYAVLRIGAVVVEHNPLYTAPELRHQFEDHRARVAIVWDKAVPKIEALPADLAVEHMIAVNLLDALPWLKRRALSLPVRKLRRVRAELHAPAPDAILWRRALEGKRLRRRHPRPSRDDLAVIQYTSGTTGRPKGAMLTHANLYANALQGDAWMHGARTRGEVFFAVLPMFHAYGMTLNLTFGILKQAHIVLFPAFDPDMLLDAWKRKPATVFAAVPPIYERIAQRARERKIDISSARYCLCGAMSLTERIVTDWEQATGGLLVEGYGMTEASPVLLGNPIGPTRRTGTIGIPFPSTDVKVVDPEDPTREVPLGAAGELLVRGPQVFRGYWENPEQTAQVLLPGGWLRTGDIVAQDADGFTTVVDRAKELIITGGFNVSPTEVEQAVLMHEAIADAAVVGVPNSSGGETVTAVVVLEPGASAPTARELTDFCRAHLAAYKLPRELRVVDELPRSMLGKVLRKKVRDAITDAEG